MREATSDQLIAEFLEEYRSTGEYLRDHVARLVSPATDPDPEVAKAATRALFGSLVERLADSFSPSDVGLYNRVFAQTIDSCRRLEQGRGIDAALRAFGLHDEWDLTERAERLRQVSPLDGRRHGHVKRVIALSRVTLGADVAITSVIFERMKIEFPGADIVLVGGSKGPELFGGESRLSFREIRYGRAGTTIDRLLCWLDVLESVRDLLAGLQPDEWLVVDPDSRLTQLGLLPVTEVTENYLFFPSREYGGETTAPLGQLAAKWLDQVFGRTALLLPRLRLRDEDTLAAKRWATRLRRSTASQVVTVNFGVGENPAKRVSDDFEQALVLELIRSGVVVILDKGVGSDEARRASAIIDRARDQAAATTLELTEREFAAGGDNTARADLVVWDGRIGVLAAMIAESNLYIGYDSAGQHLAAAARTPCIDIFAGYSSRRMLDRWRPTGEAASHMIVVDPASGIDESEILAATLTAARDLIGCV